MIPYSAIVFVNEDSDKVTFSSDNMCILSVDLNKINVDNVNFDENDPETIIHVKIMAWRNRFKQHKTFRKGINKEVMPVA